MKKIILLTAVLVATTTSLASASTYGDATKIMIQFGILNKETADHNLKTYLTMLDNVEFKAKDTKSYHRDRQIYIVGVLDDLERRLQQQMGALNLIPGVARLINGDVIRAIDSARSGANRYDYPLILDRVASARKELISVRKELGLE